MIPTASSLGRKLGSELAFEYCPHSVTAGEYLQYILYTPQYDPSIDFYRVGAVPKLACQLGLFKLHEELMKMHAQPTSYLDPFFYLAGVYVFGCMARFLWSIAGIEVVERNVHESVSKLFGTMPCPFTIIRKISKDGRNPSTFHSQCHKMLGSVDLC